MVWLALTRFGEQSTSMFHMELVRSIEAFGAGSRLEFSDIRRVVVTESYDAIIEALRERCG